MENYFSYYQRRKNHCDFYHFKTLLNDYNNDGKCLLSKEKKNSYSVFRFKCKLVIFLNFAEIANENTVVILKERQNLVRLRQETKQEKTRWEEKKKNLSKP